MYNWILGLHSILRWVLLIVLLVNIAFALLSEGKKYQIFERKWATRLVMVTHLTVLLGIYQYFAGGKGFAFIQNLGMANVMKDSIARFWAIEHITAMLLVAVLVTIAGVKSKKALMNETTSRKGLLTLFVIILVVILAAVPWPFRFAEVPWLRTL